MADVVVIGGGVAGLVAARAATRAGQHHRVRIIAPSGGGQVQARPLRPVTGNARGRSGAWVDIGAEGFATRDGLMARYLTQLGLGEQLIYPAAYPTRIRWQGSLIPIPVESILGIPANLGDGECHRALGPAGIRASRELDALPVPERLPATLAALVRLRMGSVIADRFVAPLVAGVLSRSIEDAAPDDLIPGLTRHVRECGSLAGAVAHIRTARARAASGPDAGSAPADRGRGGELASVAGGMSTLVRALRASAARHRVRRVVGRVTRVSRHAGRWQVRLGDGSTIGADEVITTVPLPPLVPTREQHHRQVVILAGEITGEADRGGIIVPDPISTPMVDASTGPAGAPPLAPARLSAVTFTSAKWHHPTCDGELLRLTYSGIEPRTCNDAVADLTQLGYTVQPQYWRHAHWRMPRAAQTLALPSGIWATGAHTLGPGLARIVDHAHTIGAAAARSC